MYCYSAYFCVFDKLFVLIRFSFYFHRIFPDNYRDVCSLIKFSGCGKGCRDSLISINIPYPTGLSVYSHFPFPVSGILFPFSFLYPAFFFLSYSFTYRGYVFFALFAISRSIFWVTNGFSRQVNPNTSPSSGSMIQPVPPHLNPF